MDLKNRWSWRSKAVMIQAKWDICPWLINEISGECNLSTTVFQVQRKLAVMEREEGGLTMLQKRNAFMLDKMGRNVGKDQAIIYCSWLKQLNYQITLVQRRTARKMAPTSNGSGNDAERLGRSESVVEIVDSSCKQVVKEISKNMVVVFSQLSSLGKDMELIQKSMEHLNTSVLNLKHKVDNIELRVETATMGVLKEVFGLCEGSAPKAEGNVDAASRELEPGARRSADLGFPFEASQEEFEPRSRG